MTVSNTLTLDATSNLVCNSTGDFSDTLTCSKSSDTGLSVTSNAIIDGNVGIGTTTPGEKLDVNGNGLFTNTFIGYIPDINNQNVWAAFSNSSCASSTDYAIAQWSGGQTRINAPINHNIMMMHDDQYTRLIVANTTGNVGINTTSPSYTLDVNGNVNCTGNLTLPDGDVQTQIDGKQATLTFGIGNTNVIKCGTDIVDNDFLRVNGTTLEGRSASELKSDLTLNNVENTAVSTWAGSSNITTLGTITTGTWQGTDIADTYISSASTWNGKQDALTFGIGNTNVIKCGSGIVDDDFLRVSGTTLEGRSASELLSDIGAQATLTSLSDIQIQSLGVGTAASGTTGEIRATNNITAYYSDERLKDFMGTIPDALEKINKLNGYYFKENELAKSLGYSNERLQIGVSAQEVEKILPEIVTEAPIDSKYKTVWYEKLVPLLIEAIKELTEKVRILEEKLLSCN